MNSRLKTGFVLILISTFVGLIAFVTLPHLERFRYGSSSKYIPYYELESVEESLNEKDFRKADLKTADIIFKVIGKEKVKRLGKLDIPNFSCQYLLKLDDIWARKSEGKFGFKAQSEILSKWKDISDFRKVESNFREVVGWENVNTDKLKYKKGYFPYRIYKEDFVVLYFSQKLYECEKYK
jgi:GUN4-like